VELRAGPQAFKPGRARSRSNEHAEICTSVLTADLAAAEGWYTKLLGRGPDYRPMDTLVQWELFDQDGLMLSSSKEIAGRGVMFLYVEDVEAERRRLKSLGIVLGDDIKGDYSTLAQVRDPDGNLVTRRRPRGPFLRHKRRPRLAERKGRPKPPEFDSGAAEAAGPCTILCRPLPVSSAAGKSSPLPTAPLGRRG
jgi:hypothetical protein